MIYKIVSSYKTMVLLLLILAIGAAYGTFVENDFGSAIARELIYNSWWYELSLFFISINLISIVHKTKMYRVKARMVFHLAFVIILLGAFITRYFGTDGMMYIREGEKSNVIMVAENMLEVPFEIELNKFQITRYPGSRSPSQFSSHVTLIDEKNSNTFKTEISMNNTLSYKGYKFFQTSYDEDEKGTKLSVNNDPGVEVTYFGYALLFLSLILNLFNKKSRFQYLIRKVKNINITSFLLPLLLLLSNSPTYADENSYIQNYLIEHKENSKELADLFGTLVVQGPIGRMKPLDTQNREVLNKLTAKSSWQGMSANQVMLGMFARPSLWKKVDIIKVRTPKLRELLGAKKDQKLLSFVDFFDDNSTYKLTTLVEKAHKLVPSRRGTFERDLISVDERLNIAFMSYRGVLLTLFPLPDNERDKWVDFKTMFNMVKNSKIKRSTSRLLDAVYNRNYSKGFSYVEDIREYQNRYGSTVMPTNNRLSTELWYNQIDLFFKLSIIYLMFGIALLIYGISSILHNKIRTSNVNKAIYSVAFLLLSVHTFALALRWYIGGYAPISNTYETMTYISYSAVLAGVLFLRNSTLALSASFIMAGIFIFAAYLGEIDPEITNLVPVLKSYWLSIHVSVITASYGFFGVGAVIALITMVLYILRDTKRPYLDEHIKQLTFITEITLILGLTLLVIGNFLGGIWANESWGRYWGWDPKETWAYISILVYVIVLHIRLLKDIYTPFLFSVLSVLAFSSILMTYFGVNFYLAGMHSYATGDPVPIPTWVYIIGGIVITMILIAYPKKNLKEKNEKN
ncbi:MAG: protein NrfI [Helicobacteraceae bacterium]|nr:protein NrfI [Helicobacteraceae bacterium]